MLNTNDQLSSHYYSFKLVGSTYHLIELFNQLPKTEVYKKHQTLFFANAKTPYFDILPVDSITKHLQNEKYSNTNLLRLH